MSVILLIYIIRYFIYFSENSHKMFNLDTREMITHCGFLAHCAFDNMLVGFALYINECLADFAVDHRNTPLGHGGVRGR